MASAFLVSRLWTTRKQCWLLEDVVETVGCLQRSLVSVGEETSHVSISPSSVWQKFFLFDNCQKKENKPEVKVWKKVEHEVGDHFLQTYSLF